MSAARRAGIASASVFRTVLAADAFGRVCLDALVGEFVGDILPAFTHMEPIAFRVD